MEILKKNWRYIPAVWIAFVFVQSLFFKFSGSNETQHIFGTLGEWMGFEPFADYGAYVVGTVELIASILLFTRVWAWGAVVAVGVMAGAIFFHLFTPLGIEMPRFDEAGNQVGSDGGELFVMACLTGICALVLVAYDWLSPASQIRSVLQRAPAAE